MSQRRFHTNIKEIRENPLTSRKPPRPGEMSNQLSPLKQSQYNQAGRNTQMKIVMNDLVNEEFERKISSS